MLKPGSLILEGSTSVNQKSPDVQHSCHHLDSHRGWDWDAGGIVLRTSRRKLLQSQGTCCSSITNGENLI